VKLIKSGALNDKQHSAALKELALKCTIYGNGCIKRGKQDEGKYYLQLPEETNNETLG
jgi:hypothetical protein